MPSLETLLRLAREAILGAVEGRPAPSIDVGAEPDLAPPRDAFVTLTDHGELRGCMGTLGARLPVGEAVIRAATMAATLDPRFWPVGRDEVARLQVEVSVLAPPHRLADPAAFVPGRDGIVVEARGRRALLLPQVATEMGWGTGEMLDAVCEKAGLSRSAWHEGGTRLSVFEVERVQGPLLASAVSPTA